MTRRTDMKFWREGIKSITLGVLSGNKGEWFTLDELVKECCKNAYWIRDYDLLPRLAFNHGLKGEITSAIRFWKLDGHTIVSSNEKGKGYCYLNPNDRNTPSFWDGKFLANESEREEIPRSERELDKELFIKTLRLCEDTRIRNDMMKIAVKHNIKLKSDKHD